MTVFLRLTHPFGWINTKLKHNFTFQYRRLLRRFALDYHLLANTLMHSRGWYSAAGKAIYRQQHNKIDFSQTLIKGEPSSFAQGERSGLSEEETWRSWWKVWRRAIKPGHHPRSTGNIKSPLMCFWNRGWVVDLQSRLTTGWTDGAIATEARLLARAIRLYGRRRVNNYYSISSYCCWVVLFFRWGGRRRMVMAPTPNNSRPSIARYSGHTNKFCSPIINDTTTREARYFPFQWSRAEAPAQGIWFY